MTEKKKENQKENPGRNHPENSIEIFLPMVPLRGMTVLPEMVIHFDVSRKSSIKAVERAMETRDQWIFLCAQKSIDEENPGKSDVYTVGCVAAIRQVVKLPNNLRRVLVTGLFRADLSSVALENGYLKAAVIEAPDFDRIPEAFAERDKSSNLGAMCRGLKEIYNDLIARFPGFPKDMAKQINEQTDLQTLIDMIAANLPLGYKDLQEILEERDILDRY